MMTPTFQIPEDSNELAEKNPYSSPKWLKFEIVVGSLVFILFYIILEHTFPLERSVVYLFGGNQVFNVFLDYNILKLFLLITILALVFYITLLFHETFHCLMDLIFTKRFPILGRTNMLFFVKLPINVYENKFQFLGSLLAPICSISLIGVISGSVLSDWLAPLIYLMVISNIAASTADIFDVCWVLKHSNNTLFGCDGKVTIALLCKDESNT